MLRSPLFTILALSGAVAAAQTATHRSTTGTAHRPASTAAKATTKATAAPKPECATLPTISDKVPGLPAGVGCPKVMFTVSDRLDYISPLAERFRSTLFADLPVVISLNYADIVQGTGELAKPQQYYTVRYTGYLTDGTKFDSSEDHEELKNGFTFPYGAHRVIAGWDLGFEGMHVGGKRRLYVPYQFAYGAGGQPPKIPPKSMLIFDMELLSQSAQPPAPPKPPTPPVGAPGATGTPGAAPNTSPSAPANAPATPAAPGTPATPPPSPGDKPVPPRPGTTSPTNPPAGTTPSSGSSSTGSSS